MKKIYFVRHGETEVNATQLTHSSPTNPLSEKGRQQAEFIATRMSKLPLEALITSIFTRAKETAEAISKKTGLPAEPSELFGEALFISKYWDQPRTPESLLAYKNIYAHWGVPGYHEGNEENFEEVIERADKALSFLAQRPETHIGVVTHGLFLKTLLARALFGKDVTPKEQTAFAVGLLTQNTGLTIMNYTPEGETLWQLWTWNDHAHLG